MKDGDIVTEKELEAKGWKHSFHLTGGTHAYSNGKEVMFWHRSSGEIISIKEKLKFSPP